MVGDKQRIFSPISHTYSPRLLQSSNIRNIIQHCIVSTYELGPLTCVGLVNYGPPHCLTASSLNLCLIFVLSLQQSLLLVLGTIKITLKIKIEMNSFCLSFHMFLGTLNSFLASLLLLNCLRPS